MADRVEASKAMSSVEEQTAAQALHAAFAKAQAAFPTIARDKHATIRTKDGGHYSYSYADLGTILEAVRAPLADNGLSISQRTDTVEDRTVMLTELLHEGGGILTSICPLRLEGSMQQQGSIRTYTRRYELIALLGLASEDDDDGAQASQASGAGETTGEPAPEGQQQQRRPPTPEVVRLTDAQLTKIGILVDELEALDPTPPGEKTWVERTRARYQVQSRTQLTKAQASDCIDWLEEEKESAQIPFEAPPGAVSDENPHA